MNNSKYCSVSKTYKSILLEKKLCQRLVNLKNLASQSWLIILNTFYQMNMEQLLSFTIYLYQCCLLDGQQIGSERASLILPRFSRHLLKNREGWLWQLQPQTASFWCMMSLIQVLPLSLGNSQPHHPLAFLHHLCRLAMQEDIPMETFEYLTFHQIFHLQRNGRNQVPAGT